MRLKSWLSTTVPRHAARGCVQPEHRTSSRRPWMRSAGITAPTKSAVTWATSRCIKMGGDLRKKMKKKQFNFSISRTAKSPSQGVSQDETHKLRTRSSVPMCQLHQAAPDNHRGQDAISTKTPEVLKERILSRRRQAHATTTAR